MDDVDTRTALDAGDTTTEPGYSHADTPIDWSSLPAPIEQPLDRRTLDSPTASPADLLEQHAPLDPTRLDKPVSDLHADRFTPPSATDQLRLEGAHLADARPQAWVQDINPGFLQDIRDEKTGRTTNCAECARSFESTLRGNPRVASAIADTGLPNHRTRTTDSPTPTGRGEAPDYTEQWAGRRFETITPTKLSQHLATTHGSAIIAVEGPEGGHAFNAYWDNNTRSVRWADAQSGIIGDWPPDEIIKRFPSMSAIPFDRKLP